MGNIDAVIYFIILGVLIGNFSKNMIIVLGVPVILVNLFVISKHSRVEGFKGKPGRRAPPSTSQDAIIPADQPNSPSVESAISGPSESFEAGRDKKKGGYDIDYASTIEDAYDQLNGILGSDGIKRLTSDTQGLIQQQLQLTKAMEGMQPLIKNMKPLLENMGPLLDQAKGIMGSSNSANLAEMAKKITSALPQK